jgi:hypothetical protein
MWQLKMQGANKLINFALQTPYILVIYIKRLITRRIKYKSSVEEWRLLGCYALWLL